MRQIICPYCGTETRWCNNKEIYGKSYGRSFMCYLCDECKAYVGCHNNSRKPLGTPAHSQLRKKRHMVHSLIDPYWKDKLMSRRQVYKTIAIHFGEREFHVGESDDDRCKHLIINVQTILDEAKWNKKNQEKEVLTLTDFPVLY